MDRGQGRVETAVGSAKGLKGGRQDEVRGLPVGVGDAATEGNRIPGVGRALRPAPHVGAGRVAAAPAVGRTAAAARGSATRPAAPQPEQSRCYRK
jgi:hypothetical protein